MEKLYISNKDESVRMFESDILNSISRIHWSIPLIIYIPIIAFFLYRSAYIHQLDLAQIILYYIIGNIIWTFIEYILHRFVFHYNPKSNFGERIHFIFHGVHHDYPNDTKRLVMVPSVSLPLAFIFYLIYYAAVEAELADPIYAGFLSGYLVYDMLHYAIHHALVKNKILLKIKQNHMKHHFEDHQSGFGVSQPLWDYVFGTKLRKK